MQSTRMIAKICRKLQWNKTRSFTRPTPSSQDSSGLCCFIVISIFFCNLMVFFLDVSVHFKCNHSAFSPLLPTFHYISLWAPFGVRYDILGNGVWYIMYIYHPVSDFTRFYHAFIYAGLNLFGLEWY